MPVVEFLIRSGANCNIRGKSSCGLLSGIADTDTTEIYCCKEVDEMNDEMGTNGIDVKDEVLMQLRLSSSGVKRSIGVRMCRRYMGMSGTRLIEDR